MLIYFILPSAENGFYIKPSGGNWQQIYDNIDFSWKPTVKDIFQYYTERTPGAYVESKDTSIVWVKIEQFPAVQLNLILWFLP